MIRHQLGASLQDTGHLFKVQAIKKQVLVLVTMV